MSRTSAYGTDFYRVKYEGGYSGIVDGPYTSEWMARRIAKEETRYRSTIQKLTPVPGECDCCLSLEWVDV